MSVTVIVGYFALIGWTDLLSLLVGGTLCEDLLRYELCSERSHGCGVVLVTAQSEGLEWRVKVYVWLAVGGWLGRKHGM